MLTSTSSFTSGYKSSETRRKFMILLALAFMAFLTLLAFQGHSRVKNVLRNSQPLSDSKAGSGSRLRSLSAKQLKDIRNSTLGFEKVFLVNLADRSDRLDAMRVTASLTGFNLELIKGVEGNSLSPKELPDEFPGDESRNSIGCWRSHMNFARIIVEEHLSTAMVFEDDVDWDVSFRSQLESYALGSQYLSNSTDGPASHSPYGDGWDLLYIGHCSSAPDPDDNRRFVMENDPTTPPKNQRRNVAKTPDMSTYDNTTRIMFTTTHGMCTYAYALSQRGARKALYYLSMLPTSKPVDFGLSDMCWKKERNFTCISVFPQLVASHRALGSKLKDSDIRAEGDGYRTKAFSDNIVHSTRLNVDHLLNGQMDKIENQFAVDMEPLNGTMRLSWRTDEGIIT